jgi:topoisomerase-4 subunit B
LEPVEHSNDGVIKQLLGFYMGKNTPERQDFIIQNLKIELDLLAEEAEAVA